MTLIILSGISIVSIFIHSSINPGLQCILLIVFSFFIYVEQIEELESNIREKETQLIHQEAEAGKAISKWEERFESISADISRCKDERDEVERSFLKLENEISSYHISIEELTQGLQVEKEQNALLLNQIEESDAIYKQHIDELEKAIQEHVEASETYESQLDERDEALLKAGREIENLNKEIVDLRQESEEVVSKWQGKTRIIRH